MAVSTRLAYVGIDVSAKTLAVRVRTASSAAEGTFSNDYEGHGKLLRFLARKARKCRIAVEATSTYSLDLCLRLHEAKLAVMLVNPRAAHAFMKAQLRRAKTDRIDAAGLCDFAERMEFNPWQPPRKAVLDLRALARRIHDVMVIRTAESNRLHAATATGTTPRAVIADIEAELLHLENRIDLLYIECDAIIQADAGLSRSYAALTTVTGIKQRAGVAILAEMAALPEDLTARQVAAHAGLDPRPFESGTLTGGHRRISKTGNSRLRGSLYMVALVAMTYQPHVKAHYERLVARGKPKMLAIVAIMRKLLHVAWAIHRSGEPFQGARFAKISITT